MRSIALTKVFSLSAMCALLTLFSVATHAQTFTTRIQAQDYTAYYDTTPNNQGGACRNDGVDLEHTSDTNGVCNVGWIEPNEWLAYSGVNIPSSGTYTVRMRVASPSGGAAASVDLNGGDIVLGEVNIPATGGWQNWTTVSFTTHINAGTYSLGVFALSGGWNFNWIEIRSEGGSTPPPSQPPSGFQTRIQAQDYTDYFDTTPNNQGGACRNDGVDLEPTNDTNGVCNVGWIQPTEWLAYSGVNIPSSGTYTVRMRVASPSGGASASVDLNGGDIVLGQVDIPATGGWQNWTTVSFSTHINAGTYSLGVFALTGGWNFNWIEIVSGGDGGPSQPPTPPGFGQLVWSDEFNTINHNNWTFETGGWGWGNYELQYYTNGDNAFIQHDPEAGGNVLVLEARQGNPQGYQCWYGSCQYTSTRMISLGKQEFQYGRIEARMRLPTTQGIWPAFWMMGNNFHQVGWPHNGELDIMEHVGFEPHMTHGALHGPGYSGNTPLNGSHNLGEPANARYRVYAVEWDENGIRWFVDNHNFYSVTRAQVEQHGAWVYNRPFFLLFNVAVGGTWPGSPDGSSVFPQRLYIDYVRVYQ